MDKPRKYKYCYRPESSLIEFVNCSEISTLATDLIDALKEINPKLIGREDLWINDEIIYTLESNTGQFIISIDIWNLIFLSSNDKQCFHVIYNILFNDNRFEIELN